jgi:hypothetical protein
MVTTRPERLQRRSRQPQQLSFPCEASILGTVNRTQCHRDHLVGTVIARRVDSGPESMAAVW